MVKFRNFPLYIQEFIQDEEHPALQLALKMHELQGIGTVLVAVFKVLPIKILLQRIDALNLKTLLPSVYQYFSNINFSEFLVFY